MFFLIMSILMIKVKDSSDIRAKWQNGFWGVKFLIIFASMIACLFIGEGGFDTFMYVLGLIGGFMFILYQLVLLVEFAHQLNETLLAKLDEVEDPRCIKFLLYLFSLGSYLAALVCVILMFVYFGPAGSGCGLNQFFISSALILSIVCGIFAIHPTVQEHQPTSGLVQAGCVSIYLCYMVYSSMTSNIMSKNNSGELCNSFSDLNGIKIFAASGLDLMNGNSIFGMIFAVVMVLYSTMSTSSLPGGDNAGSTASDIPMLESGTNSDGAKTLMVTAAEDETGNVKYWGLGVEFLGGVFCGRKTSIRNTPKTQPPCITTPFTTWS